MTAEIGQPAPDFSMPTADGGTVSLSGLQGKKIVLYFYPKADTPGCTKEGVGFSESIDAFAGANAAVIGVSKDPVAKLAKFRDKYDLKVTLASDEAGGVVEAYGSWVEKSMYGKTYMGIDRSTFLIGEDGTLKQAWRKVKVPGHVDQVLDAVKAG